MHSLKLLVTYSVCVILFSFRHIEGLLSLLYCFREKPKENGRKKHQIFLNYEAIYVNLFTRDKLY